MADAGLSSIAVNGRSYRAPEQPLVVLCIDGCEPDYITQAIEAGSAPFLRRMCERGTSLLGDCAICALRRSWRGFRRPGPRLLW